MCLHEDTGSEEVKWKKQTKKNYVTMTEKNLTEVTSRAKQIVTI